MSQFQATNLVMIRIDGFNDELRVAFINFLLKEDIAAIRGFGYGDPTTGINFYYPKDADKIIRFLQEHKIERVGGEMEEHDVTITVRATCKGNPETQRKRIAEQLEQITNRHRDDEGLTHLVSVAVQAEN